ncbi:MAG: DUF3786 domain-containing protein [Lachnospiraceae bacterium]|jgi:hypothetical protein
MESQYKDNYEKVKASWREKAVTWDYQERYQALGFEGYNEELLPVRYYGVLYYLNPHTGEITESGHPEAELSFDTSMAIYHVFYYSKPHPLPSGIWVPLREVKRAAPFERAFIQHTLQPFADSFSGKTDLLREAGKKLEFTSLSHSDAGFEAEVFPGLFIRFLFWDGDEEFPAQANVLFDANITDYVHEETAIMIGGDGLKRLLKAAGL